MNKSTKGDNPNSPEGVVGDPKATLFSVGCGTKEERKNALEVKGDGSVIISGKDGSDVNINEEIKYLKNHCATTEIAKKVEQNAADIAELKEGVKDYYVGENDEVTGDPHFKNCKGNKDFLGEWHPFLIDHTDNTGEATHPVGQLMDNNHFRFVSGAFAPTVGITEAMRAACDVQLYTDAEHTTPLTLKMVLSLLIRLAHILTMLWRFTTRLVW